MVRRVTLQKTQNIYLITKICFVAFKIAFDFFLQNIQDTVDTIDFNELIMWLSKDKLQKYCSLMILSKVEIVTLIEFLLYSISFNFSSSFCFFCSPLFYAYKTPAEESIEDVSASDEAKLRELLVSYSSIFFLCMMENLNRYFKLKPLISFNCSSVATMSLRVSSNIALTNYFYLYFLTSLMVR